MCKAYDEQRVRSAAERFWKGTSSMEDEVLLRNLSFEDEFPEDLEGIKAYLASLGEEPVLGSDFEEEFHDHLGNRTRLRPLATQRRLLTMAVLLVLFISAWMIYRMS